MLAPVLILRGEEFPTEPLTLSVDLNGDGLPEQVTRRKLGADDQLGTFYQVVVKDATGPTLGAWTLTSWLTWEVAPLELVTVRVTVCDPSARKVCAEVTPLVVEPSPQFQA